MDDIIQLGRMVGDLGPDISQFGMLVWIIFKMMGMIERLTEIEREVRDKDK